MAVAVCIGCAAPQLGFAGDDPLSKVEVSKDYTRANAFVSEGGSWTWKVIVIPKGISQEQLVSIAQALLKKYPNQRMRIFDDKAQLDQWIARDQYVNDKTGKVPRADFPEDWSVAHYIAAINDRDSNGNRGWQLVTRHGKHIANLSTQ
jgi:hypothetical protein